MRVCVCLCVRACVRACVCVSCRVVCAYVRMCVRAGERPFIRACVCVNVCFMKKSLANSGYVTDGLIHIVVFIHTILHSIW